MASTESGDSNLQVRSQLYHLGQTLDELALWFTLGPVFGILLIPAVIFLNRFFRFLTVLNDVRNALEYDDHLEKAYTGLQVLLFLFVPIVAVAVLLYGIYPLGALILLGIYWGQAIWTFTEFNKWAIECSRVNPAINVREFKNGIDTLRMGVLLSPLLIGFIIMTIGTKKAGKCLMQEFSMGFSKPNLASKIPSDKIDCPKCKTSNLSSMQFCGECGTKLK